MTPLTLTDATGVKCSKSNDWIINVATPSSEEVLPTTNAEPSLESGTMTVGEGLKTAEESKLQPRPVGINDLPGVPLNAPCAPNRSECCLKNGSRVDSSTHGDELAGLPVLDPDVAIFISGRPEPQPREDPIFFCIGLASPNIQPTEPLRTRFHP